MEAPDEVTCVCRVKWRRKPGVAGYGLINSACLPPALVSFNALSGVSLEIGNFCTLSALFNQSWFVRG
ncbi:hypothetical protein EAO28_30980 [Klebsiella pneumoniae]|uniref:Uncharacterized protein n=1 Tax=Klebsiella pneumoniae TaxID=573 RepID=A0A3P2EF95_KLEPN|nr:hypothetical protein DMP69_25580 [Klebsiella pneumoniae]PZB54969.1 hypothetical protein C3J88_26715 [Klebsiella pneumoniae subsp. pneumoniae]RRE43002.1 hypothetical protein EAO28_30980 [Klebsiella pneumoniae]HBY1528686.1 hypothetical protein [Klebsiella pneumoniae]HBY5083604.1 hypothetical protein [Klebsiella pneumoniae]